MNTTNHLLLSHPDRIQLARGLRERAHHPGARPGNINRLLIIWKRAVLVLDREPETAHKFYQQRSRTSRLEGEKVDRKVQDPSMNIPKDHT